jgi:hypothetical protein
MEAKKEDERSYVPPLILDSQYPGDLLKVSRSSILSSVIQPALALSFSRHK